VGIGGYVTPLDRLIELWSIGPTEALFNNYNSHLYVPYSGDLYRIEYDGVIYSAPWGIDTVGYAGPPNEVIPLDHLTLIIDQPTLKEGYGVYRKLGYGERFASYGQFSTNAQGDFNRNILRSIPAVAENLDRPYEIIINVPVEFNLVSRSVRRFDKGYGIFKIPDQR